MQFNRSINWKIKLYNRARPLPRAVLVVHVLWLYISLLNIQKTNTSSISSKQIKGHEFTMARINLKAAHKLILSRRIISCFSTKITHATAERRLWQRPANSISQIALSTDYEYALSLSPCRVGVREGLRVALWVKTRLSATPFCSLLSSAIS